MEREVMLAMTQRCPKCGGRVSAMEMDGGKLAVRCTGSAGEEDSCGWALEVEPAPEVPPAQVKALKFAV